MASVVTSYNGWPAIPRANDARLTVITPVPTRSFRVRSGDVAVVFDWLIRRYHAEVERIDIGQLDDWGYAYRDVRGSSSLSNHASGTAVDLNATKHPFRTSASRSMTAAQISTCRGLIADSRVDGKPVLRWLDGHDPMHWEINRWSQGGSPAQVTALAARIQGKAGPLPKAASAAAAESGPPADLRAQAPRSIEFRSPPEDLVRIVQLIAGTKIDGRYGSGTRGRVAELQRRLGLPHAGRDGVFGPGTARAYLLSLPNLHAGRTGVAPGVRLVQWVVGAKVDGDFGARTTFAVKQAQLWAGMTGADIDGNVGAQTKRAIIR